MTTSLEIPSTNSTTSLSSGETASDDFVLVSPSTSLQQFGSDSSKTCQASLGEAPFKKCARGSHKEDEVMEKVIELGKENERLKEALKNSNFVLHQYTKDFSEMQESHRANNEHVKREHQRAKEVVKKLRDDNRTLKEELKKANLQLNQTVNREDIERENVLLKEQIGSFQAYVDNLDEYIQDCEIPETVTETWQQLLGSLVFYNYKAGIPQRNEKSLAQEMACDGKSSTAKPRENYKQKYMELETEKAILQVDNEKIKVEKENLERQLEELTKECSRLKTNFEQMRQDKDEIQKLLDDQSESASKKEKQQHEMAVLCQNLQEDKQRLNDQLKTTQDKLRIAEENESLIKLQQVELEQQLKSQSGEVYQDDDELHALCREKCNTMQELYFKAQKQMNDMEERENTLCAKEREFENEKAQAQKQVEEMRKRFVAEVESHSQKFIEKTNELHSELKEAREREESLQEQLAEMQTEYSEKEEGLKEQVCQLIKENDSMRIKIEKLTELNSRRDTLYEERMKAIENKKKEKEKENSNTIEKLRNQLGAAKEERKKFQDQSHIFKTEHDRLAYQHEQITKEYDELLNSYKSMLQENRLRSHHSADIDDYAIHLAAAQEATDKKCSIISDLENKIGQMQEEIPVLKEQAEIYFSDFKAEREARERQNADLCNLREENQKLAEANRELQLELENIQNHHQMAQMQRRHLSNSGQFNPEGFQSGFQLRRGGEPIYDVPAARQPQERNEPRPQEPQHELEEPFNCPGCGEEFWSFADGENHVTQCQAFVQRNQPQINDNQCPICGNEYPDPDTLQIHVLECLRDAQ